MLGYPPPRPSPQGGGRSLSQAVSCVDAAGKTGRGPGDQGPAGSCGPGLRTLAAAKGGPGSEGVVPFPLGENPILLCFTGKATVALLWLPEGRRPFHVYPGHRPPRLQGGPAAVGRQDRGRAGGVSRRRPAA